MTPLPGTHLTALQAVFARALAEQPVDRFATAAEFLESLEGAVNADAPATDAQDTVIVEPPVSRASHGRFRAVEPMLPLEDESASTPEPELLLISPEPEPEPEPEAEPEPLELQEPVNPWNLKELWSPRFSSQRRRFRRRPVPRRLCGRSALPAWSASRSGSEPATPSPFAIERVWPRRLTMRKPGTMCNSHPNLSRRPWQPPSSPPHPKLRRRRRSTAVSSSGRRPPAHGWLSTAATAARRLPPSVISAAANIGFAWCAMAIRLLNAGSCCRRHGHRSCCRCLLRGPLFRRSWPLASSRRPTPRRARWWSSRGPKALPCLSTPRPWVERR